VKVLLENGADANAQGRQHGNALQAAKVEGNTKVVKMLLENGAGRAVKADAMSKDLSQEFDNGLLLLKAALLESLHHKKPSQCTIRYELTWELLSYLRKFFPAKQRLGSILTLTGGTVDAFGSSCKGYLKNTFSAIGLFILECLEKMFLDVDAGKLWWFIL
jgi:hypothetical protein